MLYALAPTVEVFARSVEVVDGLARAAQEAGLAATSDMLPRLRRASYLNAPAGGAPLRSRPPITASVGLTFANHLKPSARAASSGYPRTASYSSSGCDGL